MNKPRKNTKSAKKRWRPIYTGRDSTGMLWRFVGARAVSKLADDTMRAAGLRLPR